MHLFNADKPPVSTNLGWLLTEAPGLSWRRPSAATVGGHGQAIARAAQCLKKSVTKNNSGAGLAKQTYFY
jgi:hypothetical protein